MSAYVSSDERLTREMAKQAAIRAQARLDWLARVPEFGICEDTAAIAQAVRAARQRALDDLDATRGAVR